MKKNQLLLILLAAVLIIAEFTSCNRAKETTAPLIDMKMFFKNGEKDNFQISPDGKYYSYIANNKDIFNVYVQKIGDSSAVRVTNDTLRSIRNYFWKGDRIVYLQDIGGDENFQLFSVTVAGTELKALTPFPGYRSGVLDDLHFIPGKEKEMLVLIKKRDKQYFDPYLLNIETGDLTLMYKNKENFDNWVTDNNGVIRIATKTDGVNITYMYRNTDKDAFSELLTTSFKEGFYPQSFDADNKNIFLLSNIGKDKITLVEYDPVAKKEVKEIFGQPDYDLDGIVYDQKKKILASVSWTGEKAEEHFFDKQRDTIMAKLRKQFDGYKVYFGSMDDERKNGIVVVYSDKLRRKYYVCDFSSGNVKEIANPFPWINEKDMAPMNPITYKSRDGLTMRKRGVEVEYMVKDNEGHGFLNQNNRYDFYGAMEKFLDKHMKPKKTEN
jgi:dipeptidyl aminopeptidase/acylaminoacyl peptidase